MKRLYFKYQAINFKLIYIYTHLIYSIKTEESRNKIYALFNSV